MRPYREDYVLTHDIDWFFQHNGVFYHVASNGGNIPKRIKSQGNRMIQNLVYFLIVFYYNRIRSQVHINRETIEKHVHFDEPDKPIHIGSSDNNDDIIYPISRDIQWNNYIESFQKMAEVGFVSLDRLDNEEKYFVVARPTEGGFIESFSLIIPELDEMPITIIE